MSPQVTPALEYRIGWNGHNNTVVLDTAEGGHVEMTLEDFVELADAIINGLFEKGNPGRRKSFKKLPSLLASFKHRDDKE